MEEEEDDDADLDELLKRTKEKRSQREMTKAVDELRQQEAWAEATDELKLHMWNCGGILTASWLQCPPRNYTLTLADGVFSTAIRLRLGLSVYSRESQCG